MLNSLIVLKKTLLTLMALSLLLVGCDSDDPPPDGPDTTPPTVPSTSPTNGATAVDNGTVISATFSEGMIDSTITTATFSVDHGVTGTVTYAGNTATFTPSVALTDDTTYTVTITTGVKDLSENALAANYVWSFTCGAPVIAPSAVGEIVYGDWHGNYAGGIGTINSDSTGGGLFRDQDSVYGLAWSPDKSKFVCSISSPQRLVVIDTLAGVRILLDNVGWNCLSVSPWSPDGTRVVFNPNWGDSICIVNVNTGAITKVIDGAQEASFISNDAVVCKTVVAGTSGYDSTTIVSVPAAGGQPTTLAADSGGTFTFFLPRTAPGQGKIAYVYAESRVEGNEIWVMNSNGTGKQKLATGGVDFDDAWVRELAFSYDGTKLLFAPDFDGLTKIWVVDIASGVVQSFADALCRDGDHSADWSPDSYEIVFEYNSQGGIGLLDVNTGTVNRLTDSGAYPSW